MSQTPEQRAERIIRKLKIEAYACPTPGCGRICLPGVLTRLGLKAEIAEEIRLAEKRAGRKK